MMTAADPLALKSSETRCPQRREAAPPPLNRYRIA